MKRIAIVEDDRNFAEEVRKEIGLSRWKYAIETDIYDNPELFTEHHIEFEC